MVDYLNVVWRIVEISWIFTYFFIFCCMMHVYILFVVMECCVTWLDRAWRFEIRHEDPHPTTWQQWGMVWSSVLFLFHNVQKTFNLNHGNFFKYTASNKWFGVLKEVIFNAELHITSKGRWPHGKGKFRSMDNTKRKRKLTKKEISGWKAHINTWKLHWNVLTMTCLSQSERHLIIEMFQWSCVFVCVWSGDIFIFL